MNAISTLVAGQQLDVSNHDRTGSRLLLINGILLGAVAFTAALSDLAGYFFGLGPMAKALHGNLDAIGMFEAHGLALILAVMLVVNRRTPAPTWNWVAGLTHLLLGGSNIMFWPIYGHYDMLGIGIGSTAFHIVFVAMQFTVASLRSLPRTGATR